MQIILKNVQKNIKGIPVLQNISCELTGNKIYGIVGKNGSGKTMFLRTISGLIKPTNGQVFVDGKQLWSAIDFPPEMGILIEKPQFIEYLTGFKNLQMIAEIKREVGKKEIGEYMNLFSLDPNSKQIMKKYSLGMKQKIGIIQAIMENPKLLILDEPFNALDEESVKVLKNIIQCFKEKGSTVILTSHHKEDIYTLCDEVLFLENGKLLKNEKVCR